MPAKPNKLLDPCPICKKETGTIQLLYSKEQIIVRIGHYDSKGYKEAKKEYDDSLKTTAKDIILKKKSGKLEKIWKNMSTKQRKWCSFRSNNRFIIGLEQEITDRVSNNLKEAWHGHHKTPPLTVKLTTPGRNRFEMSLMQQGWQVV